MTLRQADRQLVREWNEGLVLDVIRRYEPLTRVEVAERTGLARSTVTVITSRLIRQGMLEDLGPVEGGEMGRPPALLRLRARAFSVLGMKLSPHAVSAALLDLRANVVESLTLPLKGTAPDLIMQTLSAAATAVTEQAPPDLGPVLGVGLAMPGTVDPKTGAAKNPYFPALGTMPMRQRLEQELGVPVRVENDANAAALAELCFGAGQGSETFLMVTIGVGIGAGLVVDGHLHRGFRSGAGEIGHTVVSPLGPACKCGRRGCLEAMAGDPALEARAGISREELVRRALAGDGPARSLVAEAGHLVGTAIANAATLLGPDRVVIGGEAALQAGALLLEPIRTAVAEQTIPLLADLPVLPSLLGSEAWVKGAAALVLEEAFRIPLHKAQINSITIAGRNSAGEGR